MLMYDTTATIDDENHEIASDAQAGASSDGHASEDKHSDADQEHSSHSSEEHADGHDEHGHDEHGHDEHHEHDYLGQDHLMGHVLDSEHFEVSGWLLGDFKDGTKHINIPQPFKTETPLIGKEDTPILPLDLKVTKFMVIETLVALALVAVFVPLARRIKTGDRPRGRFWNLFEVILFYIRDEVARPAIGKTDGDKYLYRRTGRSNADHGVRYRIQKDGRGRLLCRSGSAHGFASGTCNRDQTDDLGD